MRVICVNNKALYPEDENAEELIIGHMYHVTGTQWEFGRLYYLLEEFGGEYSQFAYNAENFTPAIQYSKEQLKIFENL